MAEKKKRIRRSREELLKDPNFRDQSGGNRSRKVDGKSRKARGVDQRFTPIATKIANLERELIGADEQVAKWDIILEKIAESNSSIRESNRRSREKEKRTGIKQGITIESTGSGALRQHAQAERKADRIRREIRSLKSKL